MEVRQVRFYSMSGDAFRGFGSIEEAKKAFLSHLPADAKIITTNTRLDGGPTVLPGTDKYGDKVGYVVESSEFDPADVSGLLPTYDLTTQQPI